MAATGAITMARGIVTVTVTVMVFRIDMTDAPMIRTAINQKILNR
jgi:hypothetical protein